MRTVLHLNDNWEFTNNFTEDFACGKTCRTEKVRLPHSCTEMPYNYFSEEIYQMVSGYRQTLRLGKEAAGRRIFLIIGAAAHRAQVYIDGKPVGDEHRCGYTEFTAELTEHIVPEKEFMLCIRVDSREELNQPPFGNVIDYMTYGGLYREVRLEIREQSYIEDVFVCPSVPDSAMLSGDESDEKIKSVRFDGSILSSVTVSGKYSSLRQTVYEYSDDMKEPLCCGEFSCGAPVELEVKNARLWDVRSPSLYLIKTELLQNGKVTDSVSTVSGFRRAEFCRDGFYLNGRRLQLVGLNRHQSFPYAGYAMPGSIQRLDADILSRELGLNAVRTSHYPQSQHFISRCDELGLLVFTEIPGWQHIGNDEWQDIAVRNTEEMIMQYRNHPSVILWGVRINESADNDGLYRRTNEAAHRLDPSRQTGGVRCYRKGSFLEDVYTYNDFVHEGSNRGCLAKKNVTPDIKRAYLVSEYCGHMFPTKSSDCEEHRLNLALRHARILNDIIREGDIAGSFGWCFADYNTHRDFGSGDRICYHGVCDIFRNPKLAAAVYSSMQDDEPVLEVSSSMDIGEHPGGKLGRVYIFTNADSVRFYKNDSFICEYKPDRSRFGSLRHPPIELTDLIGSRLENEEGFCRSKARLVADILNECAISEKSMLSLPSLLKAAWLMLRYRMNFSSAYKLYGKYIGSWGEKATVYRFDAIKNGEVVRTLLREPFREMKLCADISSTELTDGKTWDAAAIRLRMTDQHGAVLPFYSGIVRIRAEGPLEIIGPDEVVMRGGMGGTYVRTTGKPGKATITLIPERGDSIEIKAEVIKISGN